MSLDNFNLNFNGTDLNQSNNILVNSTDGFAGLDIRRDETENTLSDGGSIYGSYNSMRIIGINAQIMGYGSYDDYWAARRAVIALFKNSQENKDLTITAWDSVATTRVLKCRVITTPMFIDTTDTTLISKFRVELKVPDPYFFDSNDQTLTLNIAEVTGFDIPFDIPFDIGGGEANQGILNNTGDVETNPSYRINAVTDFTNPRITNITTGETFVIETTIPAGSYVEISKDNGQITVSLDGTTDYTRFFKGNYPEAAVGSNTFSLTAGSTDINNNVVITYRLKYLSL